MALLLTPAPAAPETPLRILVLGDSLTAGYGLPASDSFPVKLEAALKAKGVAATVVNGGVSGDTTAGGLARLAWMLADPAPQAVIVELGANDGLRGIDPRTTRANLDAIMTRLTERKIPVLLAGMRAPPNLGYEFGAAYEAVFADIAKTHDAIFYPFFLDGVATVLELNLGDRIHPNARGVDVIVERIMPAVERLLQRVR